MGRPAEPDEDERATVDIGPRVRELVDSAAPAEGADAIDEELPGSIRPSVDALPTQQLAMRSKAAAVGVSSATSIATAPASLSPLEALRIADVARTRVFLLLVFFTNIMGAIAAVVTEGELIARQVVIAACILDSLGALWLLALIRDPARYTPRRIIVPVLLIAFGAFGGAYYWGVASPNAALIAWGIYFFSLGNSLAITAVVYGFVAVVHGLLCVGVMTGTLADRGMISMANLRPIDQIGILVVIQFIYLVTFITARVSQHVTLQAVTKLEQAVRNLAQRDVMLAEARAELDRALKIGGPGRYTEQVVGSFRLGNLIGRGGMGEVYEAHGVDDQREAAVKLLHPSTLNDATQLERFLREAETMSRLDCLHVVRVLEVGTTPGEVPFLAMERLRGFDLAEQLRRRRRLQLPQARLFVDQVAIGLEAARVAGVVHRDLKPHNVFCSMQGREQCWKILDFGVSKAGGSGTLTRGHVVGTPAYMAPEQARGEDVDHRADVYALAAILYRAVTGHTPFNGKDVPSTLYEVCYRVPTQPSLHAQLPPDVDRVLALGLAKDPKQRFSTALQLAQAFAHAIDQGLARDERQRADELIERFPWGTRASVGQVRDPVVSKVSPRAATS